MIHPTTLQFLKNLKNNNAKEWMDDNRVRYEDAKNDFLEFTQQLISSVSGFDGTILNANLDPKKCVSRLNRDIRFSKDKTPYKTNFFAMISKGGKKSSAACYYLQIQPDASFIGGGVYMPMPNDLQNFRQEIDYNYKEWKAIVENKLFLKTFTKGVQSPENLVRVPKGFDAQSPAIEYLKMKGFYTVSTINDEELQAKNCIKLITKQLELTKPLIDFLNNAL